MPQDTAHPHFPDIDRGSTRPWRFLTALSNALSLLFAVVAWSGITAWAVGEVVSDRYAWSQWLEWIPTIFTLVGAFVCLAASAIAAALCNALRNAQISTTAGNAPLRRGTPGRASRFALVSGWLGWCAVLVYFIISETPFYRPKPEPPAFNQSSFRLVYWNAGGEEKPGWDRAIGALQADILVLNGVRSTSGMPGLQPLLDANPSVIVNDLFTVISARPIVRWGATSLAVARGEGLDPRQEAGRRRWADHGRALFFQFADPAPTPDTPPVLRTAWLIDLPSDLSLARAEVTARANEVINTFPGTAYVKDARGAWVPEASPLNPPGFPTPDLITGDFNIPRGSWSLRALIAHLHNGKDPLSTSANAVSDSAYHQAARRFCASWPRPYPFLHLDQTFLGPKLRAWSYVLRDPGSAEHFAQVVDITTR